MPPSHSLARPTSPNQQVPVKIEPTEMPCLVPSPNSNESASPVPLKRSHGATTTSPVSPKCHLTPSSSQASTSSSKKRRQSLREPMLPRYTPISVNMSSRKIQPKYPVGLELRSSKDYSDVFSVVIASVGPHIVLRNGASIIAKDTDDACEEWIRGQKEELLEENASTGWWFMLQHLLKLPLPENQRKKNYMRMTMVAVVLTRLVEELEKLSGYLDHAVAEMLKKYCEEICKADSDLTKIANDIKNSDLIAIVMKTIWKNHTLMDDTSIFPIDDHEISEYEDMPDYTILKFNKRENCNLNTVPLKVRETYEIMEQLNLLGECRFHIIDTLTRAHEHLLNDDIECHNMIAGGRTQIGKSMFKLAVALLAHQMGNYCSVVITPTQANCNELSKKTRRFFKTGQGNDEIDLPFPFTLVHSVDESGKIMRPAEVNMRLGEMFSEKGGIAFINYTESQQSRVIKAFDQFAISCNEAKRPKLVVFLDEADEMFKNNKSTGKLNNQEKELGRLLERSSLTIKVTATPVPLYISAASNDYNLCGKDIILLAADPDYVSPSDFVCMLDEDSEPVYLDDGELRVNNNFISPKLLMLYDDAILQGKRSLLIDIVSSRVRAQGGIEDRGVQILNHYAEKSKPLVVILVTGSGLQYQLRGVGEFEDSVEWLQLPKKRQNGDKFGTGDAIDFIEKNLEYFGPIVVMGYSMLFRGISVRNNSRVPTHMVIYMALANTIERVVQAFGRGTGIFKRLLKENGFTNENGDGIVKVLVPMEDYNQVQNYQNFVNAVQAALQKPNTTMKTAISIALSACNILESKNCRAIGPKNMKFREELLRMNPHRLPIPPDEALGIREGCPRDRRYLLGICKRYMVISRPDQNPYEAICEAREYRNSDTGLDDDNLSICTETDPSDEE